MDLQFLVLRSCCKRRLTRPMSAQRTDRVCKSHLTINEGPPL
jgi:hypothetical protein